LFFCLAWALLVLRVAMQTKNRIPMQQDFRDNDKSF
jgi:hypothetical protein